MCGIVGCILKENENVAPILFECISRIVYRGYDSVGLATFDDVIYVKKSRGSVEDVNKNLNLSNLPGRYGISHLRWATIGKPETKNAHPHTDETNSVAIVHNGTLENYNELKKELADEGHIFKSTTDSEIIAQLIKKYMDEGLDLEHALRKATQHLKGSYAIAAISKNEPDKIVATKKDSPLSLGIGENGFYVTSDIPAILKYAKDIITLENEEIAVLDENSIVVHDKNDNYIEKNICNMNWNPEFTSKPSYDHFTIKEINEQPTIAKLTLDQINDIRDIISKIGEIEKICFVAGGSAYNASMTGKYLIESLTSISTEVINPSEWEYASKTWDENTLVILISPSGEEPDSVAAQRQAKKTSKTLSIANVADSTMIKEAEHIILTKEGSEISPAPTKSYIAQLTVIYLIAGILSKNNDLIKQLSDVPTYIDEILQESDEIEEFSKKYEFDNNVLCIGRGFAYPIALEGSHKLNELARIYSVCSAGGEVKKGLMHLINKKSPLIAVVPPGNDNKKTIWNLTEFKFFESNIISIGSENDEPLSDISDFMIGINPEVTDIIAPLVYIVPLQLLSYYLALKKGYDPDKPKLLKLIQV